MEKKNIIQNILDQLFELRKKNKGNSSVDQWNEIKQHYRNEEADVELSEKLSSEFDSIRNKEEGISRDNHLDELLNKVEFSESDSLFEKQKPALGKVFLRVAAVLLPIAAIISLAIYFNGKNDSEIAQQIISTQKGSKTKIILEDGTTIWLNAESELRYPSTFKNADKRVVNLTGEAYFDVAKNEKKPFEVYVSDYKINVLGTSFNVKAYPEQKTFETTLEEGKIDIEKIQAGSEIKQQKISLVPNQTIVLYNERAVPEKPEQVKNEVVEKEIEKVTTPKGQIIESEDLSEYTAWKENELIFKSEALEDVIPDLERWYNIEIEVEQDSLRDIVCTARFRDETAEQAIQALCIASKIKFEIDKNKVKLKAN